MAKHPSPLKINIGDYSLFQLTFRVTGSRKIFRGSENTDLPKFSCWTTQCVGQGASFLGFLTQDPLLIWNTDYSAWIFLIISFFGINLIQNRLNSGSLILSPKPLLLQVAQWLVILKFYQPKPNFYKSWTTIERWIGIKYIRCHARNRLSLKKAMMLLHADWIKRKEPSFLRTYLTNQLSPADNVPCEQKLFIRNDLLSIQ